MAEGPATTDAALVRAAVDGDEQAFAVLYRRYEPVARRSARRAARRHPQLDVDEATNLALTRLWRALPSFDPDRELAPWAAVVLSHAVRSAASTTRTLKSTLNWGAMLARPADGDEDRVSAIESVRDDGDDALGSVLLDEEERLVAHVLQEVLSDREAKVVRLRLAGWSYVEIADRLGIDAKAVDNAMRRGLQKLRRAFADAGQARITEVVRSP